MSTLLNDSAISALITARNAITDRRDLEYAPDTADIDAVLATVPPGVNNDVDLALGRPCAVLPQRAAYQRWSSDAERGAVVAEARDEAQQAADKMMDAYYRAQCDGLPDGIVEHDDVQAGAWK